MRQDLSDSSIEYSSTDGMDDCIFSLSLPTPNQTDLQEVILLEDGEEVEIGVQWAFYYPATFVHQEVDCSVLISIEVIQVKSVVTYCIHQVKHLHLHQRRWILL